MPIMKNLKQVSKISISGFIASAFPATFLTLNSFATSTIFNSGVQGGADRGRGVGVPTTLFGDGNTGIFTQMIAIFSQTEIRKKLMLQKIPSFTQSLV